MKETEIIKYLEGKIKPKEFRDRIAESKKPTRTGSSYLIEDDIQEDEIIVLTPGYILKPIEDYLSEKIGNDVLDFLGFSFIASEHMDTEDSFQGQFLYDVLSDWANQEINPRITRETILEIKEKIQQFE